MVLHNNYIMKSKIYVRAWMVMIILLLSSFSFATDRYVSTTGSDGNAGTSGSPWRHIQYAIGAAISGDKIHVAAGTYTQDLSIPSGKTLELIGEGAGYTSIIEGVTRMLSSGFPAAGPNIDILATGTKIHGFKIKNPAWVAGFYSSGMIIGATNVEIYDNVFKVAGSPDLNDISTGLQTYFNVDISGLNIHDNSFNHIATSARGYEAIYINKNGGAGTITINNNFFSGDIFRAISTEASNTTISNNSITTDLASSINSLHQGINVNWAAPGVGTVATVTISGNTITGSGSNGFNSGIVVGRNGNTNIFTGISVTNNFVYGNDIGILISEDAGQVTVSNNSVHTNSTFCLKNEDAGTVVANCNWWGTLGFNVASLVSGNVTHTTYLENGTDNSGNPGFQPAASCGSVICSTLPNYNFTVTPALNTWTAHSETLISNSCAVYKLNCTSGMEYTFKTGCGNGATANFDTYMELFNAAGTSLSTNDDGCEQYRSKLTWTATATAVYYIKVRGYNSTKFGDYTVAYKYSTSSVGCKTPPAYDEDITPTSTWATKSATLASDQCKVYRLTVAIGTQYTFQTGCSGGGATATFDTYLELYNATGVKITGNDDGCEEGRSKIIYTGTYNGLAYLKVRGYNSSSTGTYTLAYITGTAYTGCKVPPLYDYQITPADGAWNTTDSRTINPAECHVYEVTLAAATSYTFKTGCDGGVAGDDATASFDTFLELYNSTSTLLQSNDDGCENGRSKITYTATAPGTVYLKVRGYNLESTGNYALAYMRGAGAVTCPTPPAYTTGATITPTTSWQTTGSTAITTDACYVYSVTLDAADTYTFKTGCDGGEAGDDATATFDTFLELYNAAGVWIKQDDDGCEDGRSKITYTSTGTTTVYLKVRGYNSASTGTYALAYAKGTAAVACMTPPAFNATLSPNNTDWQKVTGTIAANACYVYKITLVSGEIYTFKTGCGDGATGTTFDTWLDLYNAAGTWLQSNDDGCESGRSKITYTAPGDVVVYLKVRGYNWAGGTYDLVYRYGTAAVTCLTPPLSNETLVDPATSWQSPVESGVITSESCRVYKVHVENGEVYTFKTGCNDAATASFDTFLELYNATGVWITQNDDGCEDGRSKITWIATYTGWAYLKVRGYNTSSVGTFTLKYAKGTGAVDCLTPPLFNEELNFTQMSWATIDGTIASGECIVYKVDSIKTGVVYTFKTGCGNGATANFDTYLQLYNASGSSLAYNDDSCEEGRSTLTWTGTYGSGSTTDIAFLKVRGYSTDDAGDFTLASNYVGVKEVLTTGENQFPENRVKVYPNPANQLFTIVSQEPLTFTRIALSELTGRLVRNWNMESSASIYQINSNDFAPGIYILSIETSEGWIRKKVSIIR
ncbi:MAG: T9SS C-terminal target domain-containing protein [Bacteroidetes bacterium]|nr:MAG: T9SS C-terminal target domain-containing protein [Bacteroidota bacterium]